MQTGKAPFYGDKVFNPDVLEEDLATIRAFYLKHGYNDAAVSKELSWSNDRSSVSITVKISEGVRTMVSSLQIMGLETIPEPKAREVLQLTEGRPFRSDLIKADEHALSGLISENGHPYVKVRSDVVLSAGRTDASITFHVEEGKKAVMGNIYYRGNFKTRTSAIRRELGIEPGQPFSLKAMLEGQRIIRDMQSFDSVQFRTFGIKEEQDTITLLIDMEEIKPYYFQAATGYASDRGLYGNTRFGDRNLFGLNKEAWLGGELSQIGYEGVLGVTQHRIFGMSITNTNSLSYEKKEEFNQIFGTSVWTAALNFSHEYDRNITTSLGFRYEWRDQFLQKGSYSIPEGDEDSYEPRGALITTPFISYDTRDSFVRPRSGFYSSYAVDISKGYQNSLDNFLKHYVNLRYYISPTHRITFAWLGRMGYIYTFGDRSELPSDQLFYLGGTMDVRGYAENMLWYDAQENPIGGRLSIAGSMESRIEITRSWETALFIDTGSVRRVLTDEGSDTFKSSAGIGLRYITPIGPMGLLYGHKLNPEKGESSGRFHFSVGYTF
jgi:outer membrane protein insertion porin family